MMEIFIYNDSSQIVLWRFDDLIKSFFGDYIKLYNVVLPLFLNNI